MILVEGVHRLCPVGSDTREHSALDTSTALKWPINPARRIHPAKSMPSLKGDWPSKPALRSKVDDLRIADSKNLANANYSAPPPLWQAAVKDAQRRNGINGGDPRSGEEAVYAGFA